jgi:hypothetical protein
MKITSMKNNVRINYQGASNSSIPQAVKPVSEDEGVWLTLFKDGEALSVIDFTPAEWVNIQNNAAKTGQSLGKLVLKAANTMATNSDSPEISKGFVMVNLSTREQKELRMLARAAGLELRHALRNALRDVQIWLRDAAKLKHQTGLTYLEQQHHLFPGNAAGN